MIDMKSMRFLLAAALVATCAFGFARSEPNSFLSKSAWTHDALMTQVKTDAKVMSRFTRHFGMSRAEVIDTLGRLRAGTLRQDGVYLVYNCNDNEEIRAKVIYYKKGMKVWEDANGTPILKMSCANPMVRGTDDQLAVLQPEVNPSDNLRPVSVVDDGAPVGEVETDIVAVEPDSSAQVLGAAAVAIPAIGSSAVAGAAAFNPLVLAPLAGLGLVRTGGGGDNPTPPVAPPPPPPVPEPATMLLLGAAAGAMALRRAKAKKQ
jgi:hypothetical protein